MLREAAAAGAESASTGIPIDEITDTRAERARMQHLQRVSRRSLLKGAAAAGVAGAIGTRAGRAFGATQPRIVIVGGGLAGLRCAHKLWKHAGWQATVYEADDHVGGRVDTLRNFFANGQIVEQHGEFISSEHAAMIALAGSLGLTLEVASTAAAYPVGTQDIYWFNGGYYMQAQLNVDWQSFGWALFHKTVKQMPWPTRYNRRNSQAAIAVDHTSVADWIAANVPGGLDSAFGKLCYADVISEYGGPPESQSALNLIYVLGYDDSASGGGFQPINAPVLAGTDEKYHIQGGNDQIIGGMVDQLPAGTIKVSQRLIALKDNGNKTYTCTFQSGTSTYDVIADHVVLAIPFQTLRTVDLTKANLSALKMTAINQLQLGNTAKIQMQFNSRIWNADGFTGNSFSDNGSASGWECTNYQAGRAGILINFPGGAQGQGLAAKYGLTLDDGEAPAAMVTDTLHALEQIFPGVTAAYSGRAWYDDGNLNPFLGGAWSQYNVGQYTGFSGIEPVQEGNIHFAGEHTSMNFQGFMEGAVASGERVASEIRGVSSRRITGGAPSILKKGLSQDGAFW